ncbi:MAG TPA: hypothetical protein VJ898_09465 [Natrialbaceae archaeon]|nr:hypothetical protein [Natrialbaceae archaeon]
MSLDELTADVERTYDELEGFEAELDEEARREFTMLVAALDPDDPQELIQRAVHLLFQTTVDRGNLDFHLRSTYDVTYDEYLAGMSYDEMGGMGGMPGFGGGAGAPEDDDDRRYQF